MKIFAVVAPILMSILLGICVSAVGGLVKRVEVLEAERQEFGRWRGQITVLTEANTEKADRALADMRTTNQLLNDIRVELARNRP